MILETERLLIRTFRPDDAADVFEYLSLPEIYTFEPGAPLSLEQAKQVCLERSQSDSFYAVERKVNSKLIGHLYFNQSPPVEFMTWELGYIFNPLYQGQGYCTEASKRIIEYAFNVLGAHRVNAYCNPNNVASWHVLEHIGLKREGYFKEKAFFKRDSENNPLWHDCFAYGILAKDYTQQ